jgi:DNA-directed RNA polymerase subunit RPC12/RpoP
LIKPRSGSQKRLTIQKLYRNGFFPTILLLKFDKDCIIENYTKNMLGKGRHPRTKCPSCQQIIDLDRRYQRLERITCPHCQQVLEVIKVHPQVLDYPIDAPILTPGRGNHRPG